MMPPVSYKRHKADTAILGTPKTPKLRSSASLVLILAVWISTITGCWSVGLRAARSPGVTTPHFVTSNGLGERSPLRPLSADYDSLLARVNGDFGVKSAIVEAAGQEPEYKGSATLVVPLYIPEGAVPIRLARIPRSGVKSSLVSNSGIGTIRLSSLRRSRLPSSVTNRRQGGPRRPLTSAPTVAPSFLGRGWGRRIAPRATSRLGLHDDSETSASQQTQVVRTKKNKNSRLSHFSKSSIPSSSSAPLQEDELNNETNSTNLFTSTTPSTTTAVTNTSSSTTTSTSTTSSTTTTTKIPTTTTTRTMTTPKIVLTTKPANVSLRKEISTKSSFNRDRGENLSVIITTESSPTFNSTIEIPNINLKLYKNTKSSLITTTDNPSRATKSGDESNKKTFKSNASRNKERRPIPLPRPVEDILGHSIRTLRTSSTESPKKDDEIKLKTVEKNDRSNQKRGSLLSRSRNPLTLRNVPETKVYSPKLNSEKHKEVTKERITKRRLPFPLRLSTSSQTSSERKENFVNNSESTSRSTQRPVSKFRLPILNRKTNYSNIKTTTPSGISDGNTDKLFDIPESLSEKSDSKFDSSGPSLSVPIPVRRRRPLRPQLAVAETKNPVPNFSSLSTIPTTVTPSLTTQTKATIRGGILTSLPTTLRTTIVSTTAHSVATNNLSTTTTSSIRRIHDFFKISPNRKSVSTTMRPSTPRTAPVSRISSVTTPSSLIFPSTHYWHKPTQRSKTVSSFITRGYNAGTTTSSVKSPAEIVLASLSEVMRDATKGDKEKFSEIAADLDTLNTQLAEKGILIIYAEIDGKRIKLRNHTKNRNTPKHRSGSLVRPGNYDRDNDKFNESEQETLQAQSLSSTDDTITTIFTPSDKLEYDIILKNDDDLRGSHDGGLSSTYYNIQPGENSKEKQNEVSTTKLNKIVDLTTNKPNIRSTTSSRPLNNSPGSSDPVLNHRRKSESPIKRTRVNSRVHSKTNNESILINKRKPSFDADSPIIFEGKRVITATTTVPKTITTRTRTTVLPIMNSSSKVSADEPNSIEVDSTTLGSNVENIGDNINQNTDTNEGILKATSHMRPKLSDKEEAEIILEPSPNIKSNNHSITFIKYNKNKSNHNEDEELEAIEELLLKEIEEVHNPIIESDLGTKNKDYHNEKTLLKGDEEDPSTQSSTINSNNTGSSSVYLVGMVGIFPLAGVAAYIVRRFLRGDSSHQKTLPESEERPDGFTPPTHHHPRTHSLLPPLPDPKCGASSDPGPDGGLPTPTNSPWEFNRSKLRLVSVLGEGNFGVVWKAEARGFCDYASGGSTVLVAVKKVKEATAGDKEKCDLLRELSVMQLLGPHPNVVSLLGCCTQAEPHLVIMEYVMFGKLLTFLRDHRTRHNYFNFSSDTAALTSRDLTRFASHVATGCDYLQSRGIIHRDLAARNILVDHNKVCKIADFGMARSVQDIGSDIYEQKSKGALPIRWMAPESLYMNIFTHKSDVWSFGILCWEIVTLGSTPYPGLTAREVMRQVTEGYRLERPDHCKPELYRLLSTCWQQDLNKRPTFHQLKLDLSTLLEHQTGYIDLENFPEDNYFSMHQNNDEKL